MPVYQLVVREKGGRVTHHEHRSPYRRRYMPGDRLELDGEDLRVIRVEAEPPYFQRLVCRAVDDAVVRRRPPRDVTLDVTSRAAQRIGRKGGRLFLWEEVVGEEWLVDRVGFNCPDESVSFHSFDVEGIQVLIATDVALPGQVTVKWSLFPPLRIHIDWDGQPWGSRGAVVGNPPGTYGN